MRYKAVLFDLDGTLLDTIEDLTSSINIALKRLNFPTHDAELYKSAIGDGLAILASRILPEGRRDDTTVAKLGLLIRDEYTKRWANNTRPYEGIPKLLDGLSALGVRMSVLSNRPDEFTKVVVDRFLPDWRFEETVGAKNSAPLKPDPRSATKIASKMGLTPADFIYVGDSNTDMKTATAAGMYPVGVLWGFRDAKELIESGAEVLIKKPSDLFKHL